MGGNNGKCSSFFSQKRETISKRRVRKSWIRHLTCHQGVASQRRDRKEKVLRHLRVDVSRVEHICAPVCGDSPRQLQDRSATLLSWDPATVPPTGHQGLQQTTYTASSDQTLPKKYIDFVSDLPLLACEIIIISCTAFELREVESTLFVKRS